MARRRPAEVHVNHERWLVSYADFITLLFAFFVVMYSISQVNQSKYRVLSETFDHAFNAQQSSAVLPSDNVPANPIKNPIQVGEPSRSPDPSAIDLKNKAGKGGPASGDAKADAFQEISSVLTTRFSDLISDDLVTVKSNELWLQIEFRDSILFSSGDAVLSLQAQAIFDEIAGILKSYPNPVQVEGFTDNVPIRSARYPSNWELSSARASAIVKLLASKGVAPQRLSAVGYAEFQPVASNDNADGRAQNRRVALMIARRRIDRPHLPVGRMAERAHSVGASANSSQATDAGADQPSPSK